MQSIKEIKLALETIQNSRDIPQEWLDDERKGVQSALKSWHIRQDKYKQEQEKLQSMLRYESELRQAGYQYIAGIDEVGRGPLAGPVVSACVIMPEDNLIVGINDSKQLNMKKREELYEKILATALSVGIGVVEPEVIDDVNIYQATKIAMQKAIDNMSVKPDYLLIDAMTLDNNIPQLSLIKGDANSYQIAAASIVAKVVRDRMMAEYAKSYPQYSFEKNAGYGTKDHLAGLANYGITPIHRKTFEPIKSMIKKLDKN